MNRCFTLMELLVVVIIVSILLTLTLPAISRARRQAYEANCRENLRSNGIAMNIYAIDSNDYSMPASFGDTSDGHVNHFINYIIKNLDYGPSVFQCPAMSEDTMFDPAGHDPATGNIYTYASYIMNIIQPGNWIGAPIEDTHTAHGWGLSSTVSIPIGVVTAPSLKIHIMDVIPDISNSHSGVNNFQRTDHGIFSEPPTGLVRWVGNQHKYGFNSVFGDGHASNVQRSTVDNWAVNR